MRHKKYRLGKNEMAFQLKRNRLFGGWFYIALIMILKLQQIVNMALGFLIKKWHNSITVYKHASWKFNF